MIKSVDAWILDKCTKISHWLQRNVGITNFFVAKVGVFVFCFGLIFTVYTYWVPMQGERSSISRVIGSLILLFCAVYQVSFLDINEERLYRGKALFKNTTSQFMRIFTLTLSSLSLLNFVVVPSFYQLLTSDLVIWGNLIYLYFSVVVPLPPGMSKLRKMIEGVANTFRKPVPVATMNHTHHLGECGFFFS